VHTIDRVLHPTLAPFASHGLRGLVLHSRCGCPKIGTGTTATLPTQSNYLARARGELCGNNSGSDQTNAKAGDSQRMVSHTSPAAALPSAWGAGRFQAEGPEISYLQLVRSVIAWRIVCRNQFTTKSS
jgi:hypothetical protein